MTPINRIDYAIALFFAVCLSTALALDQPWLVIVGLIASGGFRLFMSGVSLKTVSGNGLFFVGRQLHENLDGHSFILNAFKLPWLAHWVLLAAASVAYPQFGIATAVIAGITVYPIATAGNALWYYRKKCREAQARLDSK